MTITEEDMHIAIVRVGHELFVLMTGRRTKHVLTRKTERRLNVM